MSGILVIGVVMLWFWAAVVIGQLITSKLKNPWLKSLLTFFAIAVLVPLPVADEIIGRIQFHVLCNKYVVQYIDEKHAANRKVLYVPRGKDRYVEGTAIPIRINPEVYKDAETGRVLVSSHTLIANGGWLIRTLGISETNSPLLFNAGCAPLNQDDFKK